MCRFPEFAICLLSYKRMSLWYSATSFLLLFRMFISQAFLILIVSVLFPRVSGMVVLSDLVYNIFLLDRIFI